MRLKIRLYFRFLHILSGWEHVGWLLQFLVLLRPRNGPFLGRKGRGELPGISMWAPHHLTALYT